MRLKPFEVDAIKSAARDAFGDDAVVRLFGSRVHDHLKRSDIDLHVQVAGEDDIRRREIPFRVALGRAFDDEPLDVIVQAMGAAERWIDRIALRDGITL